MLYVQSCLGLKILDDLQVDWIIQAEWDIRRSQSAHCPNQGQLSVTCTIAWPGNGLKTAGWASAASLQAYGWRGRPTIQGPNDPATPTWELPRVPQPCLAPSAPSGFRWQVAGRRQQWQELSPGSSSPAAGLTWCPCSTTRRLRSEVLNQFSQTPLILGMNSSKLV